MNYKMIGRFIAQMMSIEALFMLPPLFISMYRGESGAAWGFVYTLGILLALMAILFLFCRKAPHRFYAQEGLVCVGLSWTVMSLIGCLPFYFSGEIPSYIDAFFEIVSGFTTTGASIVADVEGMSKGLLYWRSFSHWLGGMGVLVLLLAVAPDGKEGSGFTMHLLRAESPGPNVGKLVPKMRDTAKLLYIIYIALTVINVLFLLAGGMSLFDALCTAYGTAGTGGFGVRNDSMASFSPYLQNVTTVFMALFGVNFSCYYLLLLRQFKSVIKDEELRLYLGLIFGSILLIVLNLWNFYGSLGESIRHAAFQVSSIITTTGYSSTDFDLWPSFSKAILLGLMVVGACAGSTGGGLKCIRLLLLVKSLRRSISQLLQPRKVMVVRSNGKLVNEKILSDVNAYLAVYAIILFLCFIIISLDGQSIGTNLSAVLACFNNIGPGMEAVGPACNYSAYSPLSTFVLSLAMLAGRLEIFPVLILFSRSTWKKK